MASEGSHDTNIIINNTLLTGVQNVSFEQNINEGPASLVGNTYASTIINGPTNTTARIDKLLVNEDSITGLRNTSTISGQFVYGENVLEFNSGVLNGFTVSATINQIPQIAFDFTIFGDMTGCDANRLSSATADNEVEEVPETGITVTFDKSAENAVQSFNYTENYNIVPNYQIGETTPKTINILGPIQQQANISIEVENYEIENKLSFITDTNKDRNRNISIEIKNRNGASNTFTLENAHLVSENVSAGVGNTVVANLSYRGYADF